MYLDFLPVFWDPGSLPQDLAGNWLSGISLTNDWLKLSLPEQLLELLNIKLFCVEGKKKPKNTKTKPTTNHTYGVKSECHHHSGVWAECLPPQNIRHFTATLCRNRTYHLHIQEIVIHPRVWQDKQGKHPDDFFDRAGREQERGKMLAWPGMGQDLGSILLAHGITESLKLENTSNIRVQLLRQDLHVHNWMTFPGATSTSLLKTSRDGDSFTTLGSLYHCLATLPMKNFFLLVHLNVLWHSLRPFPLALSPAVWEKRAIPTWIQPTVRVL